jgi:uncharacterized membrane protein HdeD (DUF308 family)
MSDITGHRFEAAAIDSGIVAEVREETARHWKLLLGIGVLCELAGVYSIFVPIVASISAAVLVGWALVFAGIVQFANILRRERGSSWDVAWRVLVSVLTIAAGAWIVIFPLTGTITLTVVLVAWLWAIGVTRMLAWWRMRRLEGAWAVGLNGLVSVVLGIFIWIDFPSSAAWAIGLLVGVELLFAGAGMIMLAMAGRRLADAGLSRPA